MKRILHTLGNFLWLIVLLPLYADTKPYKTPPLFMALVSMYIWFSLAIFVIGIISRIFGDGTGNWYSDIIKNPYAVFDRYYAVACLVLASFYAYITTKDAWNMDEMKKFMKNGVN